MDPRRVLTFRAVAHERSFSAAARALALTQPAVSQQVAALETEVGARLLDREPGGLKLTPRRGGAARARRRDRRAARSSRATQLAELARRRARLRIGAFPSALAALVPEAVARLRASVPGAEVLVEEGDSQALAERVARAASCTSRRLPGRRAPRREHDGLERHDLLREPFLVALAAGAPRSADARHGRRSPRWPRSRWIGAVDATA